MLIYEKLYSVQTPGIRTRKIVKFFMLWISGAVFTTEGHFSLVKI